MKMFTKRSFLKKLIFTLLLILTLFNFVFPTTVSRAEDTSSGLGGRLLQPICDLLLALGDGAVGILHKYVMQQDEAAIVVDLTMSVIRWITTIALAVLVVAAIVIAGGWIIVSVAEGGAAVAGTIWGTVMSTIGTAKIGAIVFAGIAGGLASGYLFWNAEFWGDDIKLPIYTISAEEIFANKIPMFDANFFDPIDDEIANNSGYYLSDGNFYTTLKKLHNKYPWAEIKDTDGKSYYQRVFERTGWGISGYRISSDLTKLYKIDYSYNSNNSIAFPYTVGLNTYQDEEELLNADNVTREVESAYTDENNNTANDYVLRCGEKRYYVTSKLNWLSRKYQVYEIGNFSIEEVEKGDGLLKSTSRELSGTIANWYYDLRTLAIIGLLIVLVYTGIRILTSTVAQEKSKYKQMMMDWLVAMCLVFLMHYIMIFLQYTVSGVNKMVQTVSGANEMYKSSDISDGIKNKINSCMRKWIYGII